MKVVVLLLLCVVGALCFPTEERLLQTQFGKWMRDHGKVYSTNQFQTRYNTWKNNYKFIEEFNTRNASFKLAMNKFGDLSSEEFNGFYKGLRLRSPLNPLENPPFVDVSALPASVDWRAKGAVTAIKNQGQCGSCWSFSTTGSVEGAHFLAGNTLVALSEQQLVDCSGSYGNQGCNGGLMDDAFQYIIAQAGAGLDTEASYGYKAQDGYCQATSGTCGSTLKAYADVSSGSESALQTAVANIGPVSVAIDASQSSFQFYTSGVYYEPACSSTQLDHGVLAVGYGTSGSQDYWIVKNSWGTDWGMNGYIWMSRNRNNNCGIATMASYPQHNTAGALRCGQ